ncbi:MAG: VWA domain-containing protein [Jatrophihabitantaceae bacterium]
MAEDPGAALPMLADLVAATDESLREAARRLAGRLLLDRARSGSPQRRGVSRLRDVPADAGGDLDVDRSLDAIASARAEGRQPGLDELVARDWGRPALAICLVVDASGSMSGARLATAALTAAACAWRAPADLAVLSFARHVHVHRPMSGDTAPGLLVNQLLALRGHGVTGLAGALQDAAVQLATTRSARRVTLLLSDCRATDERDPLPAARALDELLVLCPADDAAEAAAFAAASGARWFGLADPAAAPAALAALLDVG